MTYCKAVPVLAYHARNITGSSYHNNDHLALERDLELFDRFGFRVIRAVHLVHALRNGTLHKLPHRCVVITFDDGTLYDTHDVDHPDHGRQKSMLTLLRNRQPRCFGIPFGRPRITATSFVIASPQARTQISQHSEGHPNGMSDDWWNEVQQSGFIDIGSHSWNHVHPAVQEMATRPDLIEAFHRIESEDDAQLQIVRAAQTIQAITRHEAAQLFAYPYGQCNEFLVYDFLPRQNAIVAAFTTEPKLVTRDSNRWALPRFVCGHHWKSEAQLASLLLEAIC